MLLSIPRKILFRIILDRILDTLSKRLREEQAGFMKDYSCTDHIATLRIIGKKCTERQTPFHINIVDLEKAFDNLDGNSLWNYDTMASLKNM